MLPITKQHGFTLIELLVAIAIFGALSLASVQTLWDTLTTRSKQYSIENSASAIRPIIATLLQAITSASSVTVVSATQIQITGAPCRTIQLNVATNALEQAVNASDPCTPPASGFVALTPPAVTITAFSLSPTGATPKVVLIAVGGTYNDSLGSHAFEYNVSVSPRVSL